MLLIFLLLGIQLLNEIENAKYYFHKFLMERYINDYNFKHLKKINSVKNMRRNYTHYLISNNNVLDEKKILQSYFG